MTRTRIQSTFQIQRNLIRRDLEGMDRFHTRMFLLEGELGGNEYTRMIILVFMHNVVTKFRWEKLIPNEKVVSDPHPRPAHGLPICLYSHENYLIL